MQLSYEVTLDYGDRDPSPGEASPSATDIENSVIRGLERDGFTGIDVVVQRL